MLPLQGAIWNVLLFPKALPLGWVIYGFQPFVVSRHFGCLSAKKPKAFAKIRKKFF